MSTGELIWGAISLALTVMVLSYLIGDNFMFKLAAYLFVGVTSGFLVVLIIRQILLPYLFVPLVSGSWLNRAWLLIPLGLATLLILSQFSRFSGVGRIPLAFLAGLTAGITIGGAVFGTMIPQVQSVVADFDPYWLYETPGLLGMRVLEAVVMFVGVAGTLSYFHFGRRRATADDIQPKQRPWVFEMLGKVGQVFIGIALGAVFAGIFSSALVALIDRMLFIGAFITRLIGGG